MPDLDLTALRAKAEAAAKVSADHRVTAAAEFINARGDFEDAIAPSVILALLDRVEKAEALIAKAGKATPAYKAVEKALDEHSAWIARPNREVTEAIALAAVIAADIETGASHVLGALHERCDAAEAEIAACRALLARAGEALNGTIIEIEEASDKMNVFGLNHPGSDVYRGLLAEHLGEDKAAMKSLSARFMQASVAARAVAAEIEEATR